MNEFSLIERYFDWQYPQDDVLGVGDDCAVTTPPSDQRLAHSVDTLIEGVHFPKETSAKDIAYKALAVNLSDLAAMGATPLYFTLALTLPKVEQTWLAAFSSELKQLADQHHLHLIGGDTTKGPLSITINITGALPKDKALLRSGAQAGDALFVSGTLGDGALAWQQRQQGVEPSAYLSSRFNRPEPQVKLGQALLELANSCIDLSDGLEQDLGHILKRSKLGAELELAKLPLSPELAQHIGQTGQWCLALAGGDDYQLCFSVSPEVVPRVLELGDQLGVKLTQIGTLTSDLGLRRIGDFQDSCQSYQHFD